MHGCSVLSALSDSLQPHELYPIRLLCPWDSPGKDTGVGCQALLHRIVPAKGSNAHLPASPALQADSLPTEPRGKPDTQQALDKYLINEILVLLVLCKFLKAQLSHYRKGKLGCLQKITYACGLRKGFGMERRAVLRKLTFYKRLLAKSQNTLMPCHYK